MMTLIVPIAADKADYAHKLPQPFRLDDEGTMYCVKAITGMPLEEIEDIYFVILRAHDERFMLSDQLSMQFRRHHLDRAHVTVLDEPTSSQAETVARAIEINGITGMVFIKDADCYFTADEILPQNGVAIYALENLPIVDPQHKSYVAVDDMFYVTNIIEKRVVSHFFCAGGYCFEDAQEFCRYYERLKDQPSLYLSHIIYSMLLDKKIFRPIIIDDYQDWSVTSINR
jgi:hypothetical protein